MTNYDSARQSMVISQLQPSGVITPAVLSAFAGMPRELFVPDNMRAAAYADCPLDLGGGRVLSAPLMLAKICQAADIKATDRVLCIGSMTGYAAAILCRLAGQVVDYEPEPQWDSVAKNLFSNLGLENITRVSGPPTSIPRADDGYDVIVFDGAVAENPEDLVPFLKRGGVLFALIVPCGHQIGQVTAVQKTISGDVLAVPLFDSYAPYIPGFELTEQFLFV